MFDVVSVTRRLGSITLDWGDGTYSFQLKIKQLIELQEKCNAGPQRILARLADEDWRVGDVRETIRLGLIGAGLEPVKAVSVVRRYVDERPLIESVLVAQAILSAAIVGVPEDGPTEKPEAPHSSNPTSDDSLSGAPSSEPGSQPD